MNDQEAISRFLEEIECLDPLMEWAGKLNIFEILGLTRTEIRHSNMLAWLLDPGENHGLGGAIFRGFMEYITGSGYQPWDFDSFVIRREWNCIDLMAVSDQEQFVLCIENKIDTGEHDNQLDRYKELVQETYPDYHKAFIYLTPKGTESSNPEQWLSMGYAQVLKIIEQARDGKILDPVVDLIISNYTDTIRKHVIRDDSIRKACEDIYHRHPQALELIWNRADGTEDICLKYKPALDMIRKYKLGRGPDHIAETIHRWAKERTDEGKIFLALENTSDATTRFTTAIMSGILPDVPGRVSAWKTENFYFYEVRNQCLISGEHEVYIQMAIGSKDMPDDLRETCDRINAFYPAEQKKEDWAYRINFSTKHVIFGEDTENEALINQLDAFLEDVQEFERELSRKMGEKG